MNSSPLVSVLVPVYNAAPFLPQCFDSLLSQTLHDVQVVCVDDASTDSSLSVLRDYSQRDARVEVIHLDKNVGLAKARNAALEQARGQYVCMVDADDWLSADALQQAVDVFAAHPATGCVLFRLLMVYGEGQQREEKDYPCRTFTVLTGDEACLLSLDWQIHGLYMVRADIQRRYPYDDTCRVYSDENTTRVHFAASAEVRCCSGIYYYRQHGQSVTHRVSVSRFDRLRAFESLLRQLAPLRVADRAVPFVTNQLWLSVVDLFYFLYQHGRELSPEERRWGLGELHRVWLSVDVSLFDKTKTSKFGYRHCPSWWLFRLQEWLYFTLRKLIRRE